MDRTSNSRTRIALIAHTRMFTEMLARAIAEQDDMTVVAEIAAADDAGEELLGTELELAIVGVESQDGPATSFIKVFKSARPEVKVVVLTVDSDIELFLTAVEAGADCYMAKDRPLDQLMHSLRAVRDGYCLYDSETFRVAIAELMKSRVAGRSGAGFDLSRLSPREREVARLLATGLSNKEIAHSLGISLSTTKTHASRVYQQLGVSSRRELLARFYGTEASTVPR